MAWCEKCFSQQPGRGSFFFSLSYECLSPFFFFLQLLNLLPWTLLNLVPASLPIPPSAEEMTSFFSLCRQAYQIITLFKVTSFFFVSFPLSRHDQKPNPFSWTAIKMKKIFSFFR